RAGGGVSEQPGAWTRATSMRTEPTMFSGKDPVNPRAGADAAAALWLAAGITSPRDQIDVAEIYVPFSWFEPMWLENLGFAEPGRGWRLTEAGETRVGGARAGHPARGGALPHPHRPPRPPRLPRAARAGVGQGRGPPGGRGPDRPRPRLRRRLPVLLDVGGRRHPVISGS